MGNCWFDAGFLQSGCLIWSHLYVHFLWIYQIWHEFVQEISEGRLSCTDAQNPVPHASRSQIISLKSVLIMTVAFSVGISKFNFLTQISIFPSKEFYGGFLEDGESVKKTRSPWHIYRCFGPFFFFDIDGVESQPSGSGSWVNEEEVEFIALLYHKLASKFEDLKSSSQLAVISPYRHQVKLLRERFRATFGDQSDQIVDINTVDGFQGREKDIAIFSCVRANSGKGIGFVSDFRRMNVGITRARSSVLVVGSASTLMQDDHWKNLVKSAQDRKCYYKVTKPYGAFFNDANLDELRAEDPWKKKAKIVDELHGEMAVMENMAVDNVEGNAEGNEDYGMEGDGGGYDDD